MNEKKAQRRSWAGIVLVIIGLVFLLDNLDVIPYYVPQYIFKWESILIIIGIGMLSTGRRAGVGFILVGGFFLVPDLFYIPGFYPGDWWPVVLVAVGISIILKDRNGGSFNSDTSDDNYLDEISIFGGSKKVFTSPALTGGKITSVFGGSEINLTHCDLAPGRNLIDVFFVFGGSSLIVPADWNVKVKVTSIFGGFSDERNPSVGAIESNEKELVIKGFVMFGGGEIKSA